jgi:hypothetical protein
LVLAREQSGWLAEMSMDRRLQQNPQSERQGSGANRQRQSSTSNTNGRLVLWSKRMIAASDVELLLGHGPTYERRNP